MHDDEQQQYESISALVDGQLGGLALTHTVAWVTTSPEARATWHAYHVLGDVLRCPELAANAVASTAAPGAESPVMLRDPRLDELLAAHRQFGGTSALQMPTGFLRNATFEPSDR